MVLIAAVALPDDGVLPTATGTFGTDYLGMIFSGMDGDPIFIRARGISFGEIFAISIALRFFFGGRPALRCLGICLSFLMNALSGFGDGGVRDSINFCTSSSFQSAGG